MPGKTRKLKKQTGGAVPYLPRDKAPIVGKPEAQLITEFFQNNSIYLISAHGNLSTTRTYKVPQNTYILHFAPSGVVCPNDDIFHELLSKKGAAEKPEAQKKQLWKLLTGQKQEGYYKNMLYNPKKRNNASPHVALYAPGDVVHDMNFHFMNPDYKLAITLCGIYSVPVSDFIFKMSKDLHSDRREAIEKYLREEGVHPKQNRNGLSQKLKDGQKKIGEEFSNEHDPEFHALKENLLKPLLATKKEFTESEIMSKTDILPNPEGGLRIFFVISCRAPDDDTDKNMPSKLRRKSINLRKYQNPQIEKLEAFLKVLAKNKIDEQMLQVVSSYLSAEDQNAMEKRRQISEKDREKFMKQQDMRIEKLEKNIKDLKEAKLEELEEFDKEEYLNLVSYYKEVFNTLKQDLESQNN
jgi:hypothetical protein